LIANPALLYGHVSRFIHPADHMQHLRLAGKV
jgi:hypothetical protein